MSLPVCDMLPGHVAFECETCDMLPQPGHGKFECDVRSNIYKLCKHTPEILGVGYVRTVMSTIYILHMYLHLAPSDTCVRHKYVR